MSNRQYFTWSLYFGLQSKGNIRLSFPAHNTTSIAHTDSVVNANAMSIQACLLYPNAGAPLYDIVLTGYTSMR